MLPISRPSLPPLAEYVRKLERIWASRLLSNFGSFAKELEAVARRQLDNPNVHAVVSCDVGLIIAIASLELPAGSVCLLPSFTFNSTINAVLWNKLVPQFVDIDSKTLNIDLEDVRRRLKKNVKLIVATHVFGSPVDIQPLLSLELPVVFDAAHAYGASYRGRPIGHPTLGDLQVFSLSGTKQVTSAEGGLIASKSAKLARKIELLRAYGFNYDYISRMAGINGKMSELHAALGTLTLPLASDAVKRRNEIAARYRAQLPSLRFQTVLPDCVSAYKDFAILCPKRRDALAEHLAAKQIQTKKYFVPLHRMPAYARYATAGDDLADTEAVARDVLCLPMFNELTDADVDTVAERIVGFYGRK